MAAKDDLKVGGLWLNNNGGTTRSREKWSGMLSRSTPGNSFQISNPCYSGCTRSENFSDFQYFAEWYTTQKGYKHKKYHLEKDILGYGVLRYSEDNCVLVPAGLNAFFARPARDTPELPEGVYVDPYSGMYRASRLHISGTKTLHHVRVVDALVEYKYNIESVARGWYDKLQTEEYEVDERVIERMRTWEFVSKTHPWLH